MNLPFIGEVSTATFIMGGLAALIGYIIGSQLKSGLKLAIILVAVVFALGFITPQMVNQLAQTITALKPLYESFFNTTNMTASTIGFLAGFIIGLFKG